MSENLKDSSGNLLDNTVEQSVPFDGIKMENGVLEFTDQELLGYEEGSLTKKEKAKFLLLSPLVNSIIKFALIGLGLIGGIFWLISALVPGFSNAMTGSLYSVFTTITAAINNIFPISMMEIVILLTLLGWLGYLAFIIVRFVQVRKKGGKLLGWRLWIQFGYATLAVVMTYTLFYSFGYGLASKRTSFVKLAKDADGNALYSNNQYTQVELTETMLYLSDKMNNLVITTQQNADSADTGIFYLQKTAASRYSRTGKTSTKALAKAVNEAFKLAGESIPALKGPSITVKEALASPIYTSMGIGSLYSPLTGEVIVNPYFPEVSVPMLVAKAIAKERGFHSDAQANLIAYLVLTQYSDVPYLQYSAYFNAYLTCGSMLTRQSASVYATISGALKSNVKKEAIYYVKRIDSLFGNKNSLSYVDNNAGTSDDKYKEYPMLMVAYYRDKIAPSLTVKETNFGLYINCLIEQYQKDSDFQQNITTVTEKYNQYIEENKTEVLDPDGNKVETTAAAS